MKKILTALSCALVSVALFAEPENGPDLTNLNRKQAKVLAAQRGEPADLETIRMLIEGYSSHLRSFGIHEDNTPLLSDPSKESSLNAFRSALFKDPLYHIKLADDSDKQEATALIAAFREYNSTANLYRRGLVEKLQGCQFPAMFLAVSRYCDIAKSSTGQEFWTDVKSFDDVYANKWKPLVAKVRGKKEITLASGTITKAENLSLDELLAAAGMRPFLTSEGRIMNGLMGKFCSGACVFEDKCRTKFGDKWVADMKDRMKKIDELHTMAGEKVGTRKKAVLAKLRNAPESREAVEKVMDFDDNFFMRIYEFGVVMNVKLDELQNKGSYPCRLRRGGDLKNIFKDFSSADLGSETHGCQWLQILRKRCVEVRVELMDAYKSAYGRQLPLHSSVRPQF